MTLNDKEIKAYCREHKMISPFVDHLESNGMLSYGLSSFGYDIRLADSFVLFEENDNPIDPKGVPSNEVKHFTSNDPVVVPPHSFILGRSVETIQMPENITGIVFPKSTYARCGLGCEQTVLEAGWCGQITLEFSNHTNRPILMYPNEGCAQIVFVKGKNCETSYAQRKGKYQWQSGVTLPFC